MLMGLAQIQGMFRAGRDPGDALLGRHTELWEGCFGGG